ncbi:MAG: S8 family serine peptidase [Acidobacteriota bacterium]
MLQLHLPTPPIASTARSSQRLISTLAVSALATLLAVLLAPPSRAQPAPEWLSPTIDEWPAAFDAIVSDEEEGQATSRFDVLEPFQTIFEGELEPVDLEHEPGPSEPVLAPALADRLFGMEPWQRLEVIVSVEAPAPFSMLPPLRPNAVDGSAELQERLDERAARFDAMAAERFASQHAAVDHARALGGEVSVQLALCNCFVVELEAGAVTALVDGPGVRRVEDGGALGEPTAAWSSPVGANASRPSPADARAKIGSDALYLDGWGRGRVALIDSGVGMLDASDQVVDHNALRCSASAPTGLRIRERRTCTAPGSTCVPHSLSNLATDRAPTGHGTRSAAILSGLDSLGVAYRGVSRAEVASFHVTSGGVFGSTTSVRPSHALRAMNQGVVGNRMLFLNVELPGGPADAIARAADDAFDLGTLVVSSVGNVNGATTRPGVPAAAAKTLAVGALSISSFAPGQTLSSQRFGPLLDGRHKPEIQMPSVTMSPATGSLVSNPNQTDCRNCVDIFPATSGAAPYAAGAAVLIDDWLHRPGPWQLSIAEPGQVYSTLIALGDRTTDTGIDAKRGAGLPRLPAPDKSRVISSKRTFLTSSAQQITFDVKPGDASLEVGVWWPDRWNPSANRYDHVPMRVELRDPAGTVVARGTDPKTVFHRFEVTGWPTAGSWTLVIEPGTTPPSAGQQVFATIHREGGLFLHFPRLAGFWAEIIESPWSVGAFFPLGPSTPTCP